MVGTPRKVTAHRKEGTPPMPSTPSVKGRNAQTPPKNTASATKCNRPSTALASPLHKAEAVPKAWPSPLRKAESAADVVRLSNARAESGSSPGRIPSKLKLRKSIEPVTKTPANSPAGSSESRALGGDGQ